MTDKKYKLLFVLCTLYKQRQYAKYTAIKSWRHATKNSTETALKCNRVLTLKHKVMKRKTHNKQAWWIWWVKAVYDKQSRRHRKITEAISRFICVNMVSAYTVEKQGFRALDKTLDHRYNMPERKHLMQLIMSVHCNWMTGRDYSALGTTCSWP